MTVKRTIAIVGANGALGKPVLDAFTSDLFRDNFNLPIRVITRNPGEPNEYLAYHKVSGYDDKEGLDAALNGVDTVINLLNTQNVDTTNIVDSAAKNNVGVWFDSTFGKNYEDGAKYAPNFFKNKIAAYQYANSKLPKVVRVENGIFVDWAAKAKSSLGIQDGKFIQYGSPPRIPLITVGDVGRSVAALAARGPQVKERYFIQGDKKSFEELAQLYEKYSGQSLKREKIDNDKVTADGAAADARLATEFTFPDVIATLRGLFAVKEGYHVKEADNDDINPGLWKWTDAEHVAKEFWSA